jgi:fermentation-respiration switch protein FrsA (DUF1100 family)
MLWRVLGFAAIALAALFLFAQFIRRTGMFFPSRYPAGDWNPHAYGVVPEDHVFAARDGVRLHGWLFRAAGAAPLMVWFHGNGGNLTDRAAVAAGLARRGVSVFVFDWRGYGKSEGAPSEAKLKLDALAAYGFAAAHAKPDDIVLYGESLGGPYAAYVAKERKARCVVIENSFPSLAALGNALYRPLPLGWFAPFALRTTAWLNDAGLPVLVLHGKRDAVIPFALGQKLYDDLRVPKQMFVCESGGHCEIPYVEGPRYYDAVVRFVTKAPLTRR